jgi:hypothetical protein
MFREVFGRMFGAVYDEKEMTIVTHVYPDADAALAAWLLREAVERLGGNNVNVLYEFVPAGQRGGWSAEDKTVFVVDTGGAHDPDNRLFDHHFAPLASDAGVSAASLVWDALREYYATNVPLTEWLNAVKPLVDVVTAGDHGRAPAWSYQLGPHALIANIRAAYRSDNEALLIELFRLFDMYSEEFMYQVRVMHEASCCVTQLTPNIVLIKDGSSSVTRYVLDELGNALALFINTTTPNTVAVGIQRATERLDIDTGAVLARMKELAAAANDEATLAELGKWYAHPSGFAAIRGTMKHPDDTPVDRSVESKLRSYLIRAARELGIN